MAKNQVRIPAVLKKAESELVAAWLKQLRTTTGSGSGKISENELGAQAQEFIGLLAQASEHGNAETLEGDEWSALKKFLETISASRVSQGFDADQTAAFILSFKKPLFTRLRQEVGSDHAAVGDQLELATALLDKLALLTVKAFQKARESVILRQQEEMLELSTPVVKLWDGVLALPMIGTLDSARTQIVMESLLQRIVETGSELAIIDITGVPTVDTLVAQHLLKTVTAIRLMGADCIVSGIRPQIAQTIVHLGVELGDVTTKATLADALQLAMKRLGFVVKKVQA